MQEFGPCGVLKGEFIGVDLECISDRGVHDGLRSLSKWSLNRSGFYELGLALTQRKANRADPLDVQAGLDCQRGGLADGETSPEVEVFEGSPEVTLNTSLLLGMRPSREKSKLRTRKFSPNEAFDCASLLLPS